MNERLERIKSKQEELQTLAKESGEVVLSTISNNLASIFFTYVKAVRNMDELKKVCTKEELETINQSIKIINENMRHNEYGSCEVCYMNISDDENGPFMNEINFVYVPRNDYNKGIIGYIGKDIRNYRTLPDLIDALKENKRLGDFVNMEEELRDCPSVKDMTKLNDTINKCMDANLELYRILNDKGLYYTSTNYMLSDKETRERYLEYLETIKYIITSTSYSGSDCIVVPDGRIEYDRENETLNIIYNPYKDNKDVLTIDLETVKGELLKQNEYAQLKRFKDLSGMDLMKYMDTFLPDIFDEAESYLDKDIKKNKEIKKMYER